MSRASWSSFKGSAPGIWHRAAVTSGLTAGALLAMTPTVANGFIFTVDQGGDSGDGTCAPGACNLREALQAAAANNNVPDEIRFASSVTGSIVIGSTLPFIDEPLYLDGPGAQHLTISGNDAHRIFRVETLPGAAVTIAGVTLRDGFHGSAGGAIRADSADLTVRDSVLVDNEAPSGGAIEILFGNLVVDGSTISGNRAESATQDVAGAGLHVPLSAAHIHNSTIHGNVARVKAGAYGATAGGVGSGLRNSITIEHSTITGNTAESTTAGDAFGGGVSSVYPGHPSTLRNSVIAGNRASAGTARGSDIAGAAQADFSLIQRTNGVTVTTTAPGSNIFGADPRLGPLKLNGGTTLNRAPGLLSPVLDQGRSFGVAADQRGATRPAPLSYAPDSKVAGADASDMGAFESGLAIRCRGKKATRLAGPGATLGTRRRDVIVGIGRANAIRSRAGDDLVCAGRGQDKLYGGPGRDVLLGGAGPDRIFGGIGRDRLLGGGGPDRLFGGPGRDRLRGGGGVDRQLP